MTKKSQFKNHSIEKDESYYDDLLYRYLEGTISEKEIEQVEQLLETNHLYQEIFKSLVKNLFVKENVEVKRKVDESLKLTPKQQVQNILQYIDDDKSTIKAAKNPANTIFNKLKIIVDEIITPTTRRYAQVMIPIAASLFLLFYGWSFYLNWQSTKLADKGRLHLAKTYYLTSRNAARPSGGFNYFEFGNSRGEDTSSDSSKILLQKAIKTNPNNARGHQYLGTYHLLIDNNLEDARKEYLLAYKLDSTNAIIINDLGVLAMKSQQYTQALDLFTEAIKNNANILEPKYNLALAYQNLEQFDNAKNAWDTYLQHDSTSIWADIARDRLDKLKE